MCKRVTHERVIQRYSRICGHRYINFKLQIYFLIFFCTFHSQAVLNACGERSERGGRQPPRSNPGQSGPNRPQSSAAAARARRGRLYGVLIALAVLVVFFTVIGIILKSHHEKKTGMMSVEKVENTRFQLMISEHFCAAKSEVVLNV